MADHDQHDFDDFDNLTEDTPAAELDEDDDVSFGRPDNGRQGRQMIFYAVLAGILILAIGSAWFLFIRQPDGAVTTINAQEQAPVVAESQTAPAPQTSGEASALPPGVVSPQDMASASNNAAAIPAPTDGATIVPVDPNAVNPEVATPQIASPEVAAVENKAPPTATISSTGTTAEALPPPIAAPTDQAVAPPVGTETAALPTPVDAPAMATTPAPATETTMPPAETTAVTPVVPSVETPAAVTPTANAADANLAAENSSLKDQIKELNAKMDQMSQQVSSLEQQNHDLSNAASTKETTKETAKETSSDPLEPVAPQPVKKKTVKKTRAKTTASAGANWELRSAQPGAAWLGKVGKDELVRYSIGQNVPGLGTIQDVTKEGGRWIVKTTGGTLRE